MSACCDLPAALQSNDDLNGWIFAEDAEKMADRSRNERRKMRYLETDWFPTAKKDVVSTRPESAEKSSCTKPLVMIPLTIVLGTGIVFLVQWLHSRNSSDSDTTTNSKILSHRENSEPRMRVEQLTLDTEYMIEETIISTGPQGWEPCKSPFS